VIDSRGCRQGAREDVTRRGARHRGDEQQPGPVLVEPARRGDEILRQSRHLAAPAARQQGDHVGIRIERECGARGAAVDVDRYCIGQRVPDELGGDAVRVVKSFFERQQA